MDSFYGNWRVDLEKNEGVAEIGKLLGWTEEKQAMFASLIYLLKIEQSGDQTRCLVDYGSMKLEFSFKLGEPFDYNGADGTHSKCTVSLEDGKLIENHNTPEGAKWRTERVLLGSTMTAITKFDGHPSLKCVQELVKV